jgi:hypothetical protein
LLVATTLYFGFPDGTPDHTSIKPGGNITTGNSPAGNPAAKPTSGPYAGSDHKNITNAVIARQSSLTSNIGKSTKPGFEKEQMPKTPAAAMKHKSHGSLLTKPVMIPPDVDLQYLPSSTDADLASTAGITRISPVTATLSGISPGTDTVITITNAAGIVKFRKNEPVTNRFFSANLGITPELAFYSEPEVYSKTNFWLNGGVTYHISRFSVGSGFGLGYVYDEGKYRVEYKSNDSIGYYTGVTSYVVGTDNEITYLTQTINVYDSLMHLADSRTQNRYSYLQVPLLLGYRIFESNRVSLTFQVGPAVSILLGSRKSDPVIEYSNARIIRVDNETPSRIHTNWQIWANLYFEMRMNKQVSIFLEPSFKYYLKPMVTQENVTFKAPWTIGLGVGLQVNFGPKKTSP